MEDQQYYVYWHKARSRFRFHTVIKLEDSQVVYYDRLMLDPNTRNHLTNTVFTNVDITKNMHS